MRIAAFHNRYCATRSPALGACALALAGLFSPQTSAAPTGAAVINGQVSFAQQGSVQTITNSNGAIINWQSFSIAAGETTRFVQPSSASSVLNRVTGPAPSSILGSLSSNGRVFLINPAGILVGAGAKIDVAAFVASSLNLRNEDFLANRLNFQSTPGAGSVRNEGIVSTPQGGRVYLVAPTVANSGSIIAPGGDVALAAGRTVQIGDTATPGVRIEVSGTEAASNLGQVVADAGRIGMFGALVRNSGTLNASSAAVEGGRILLKATGDTVVSGDASISATGTRGGRIELLGNRVALTDRASADASGSGGGGTVLVGGDYQGRNPDVQNAQVTWVGPQASLRADATKAGDGGLVVVWSDDTTRAYGEIFARGGAQAGNGGNIETSGKRYLDVEGVRVSAAAPRGSAGTWLLDPDELRIVSGAPVLDANISAGPNFTVTGTPPSPTLSTTTLNAAINGNANVSIATGASGGGTGDITFDASGGAVLLDKVAGSSITLKLNAWRNIIFSGGPTTFRASSGGLSLLLNSDLGGGGGRVHSNASATVNLVGTNTVQTVAVVGRGKAWDNDGSVNLVTNAVLKLYDAPYTFPENSPNKFSTFNNFGSFNTTNITNNWFILSDAGSQSGIFNNSGLMNIGTGGGSIEAVLNNLAAGTIKVLEPVVVSVQNGQNMSGAINLVAGSTLVMSENHGIPATFAGTAIGGNGTLTVSGQTVRLDGVKAPETTLNLTGGNTTVGSGGTVFGNLVKAAPMTINNGGFALAGDFVVPAGITYLNDVGLGAGGNLTLAATPVSANNITLAAGGGLIVTGANVNASSVANLLAGGGINLLAGGNVSGSSGVNFATTGNVVMNGGNMLSLSGSIKGALGGDLVIVKSGSGSTRMDAFNAIDLALLSPTSKIVLGTGSGGNGRISPFNGPVRIDFTNRADGGIFVDATPSVGPGTNGSGFFVGSPSVAAVRGANLFIKYGAVNTDICKALPGFCVLRPLNLLSVPRPPQPRQLAKEPDEGIGSFGDETGKIQKKRPGVCKAV